MMPGAAVTAAPSYRFLRLEIEAEVLEDGSMTVSEYRTVQFTGSAQGMYQWINKTPGMEVLDARVEEDGIPYEYNPGSPYGPAGTYFIRDEPGRFYIDWSFQAYSETRTFVLSYRVANAVLVHEDVAEVYYKFVGDEWEAGTEQVRVRLILPPGAEREDLRAWGHGPLHGEVSIVGFREVVWEANPLPANTFLEGRVTFPTGLVPLSHHRTGVMALNTILDEEERWASQANRQRLLARFDWVLGALALLACAFLAFYTWLRYGKEHTPSFQGDYYRELPADYTPGELGVLWRFGAPGPEDFTATIVDLARRGWLSLEEFQPEPKGLFKRGQVDYRVHRLRNDFSGLKVHEAAVMGLLFDRVTRTDQVTFGEIEGFARARHHAFFDFWKGWRALLCDQGKALGFFDSSVKAVQVLQVALGALLAMLALGAFALGIYAAGIGLVAGGILLAVSGLFLWRRSEKGAEDFARWRAFRRFLLHFSEMRRHELPSLVIWEHYLVYAITLGVASEVIRQLKVVYRDLQDGTHTFGYGWYAHGAGASGAPGIGATLEALTQRMNSGIQQSLRLAASKSSSGSGGGGGFSGGGGGGMGGGGGGVR
jgi:uncharacterized membrane protein